MHGGMGRGTIWGPGSGNQPLWSTQQSLNTNVNHIQNQIQAQLQNPTNMNNHRKSLMSPNPLPMTRPRGNQNFSFNPYDNNSLVQGSTSLQTQLRPVQQNNPFQQPSIRRAPLPLMQQEVRQVPNQRNACPQVQQFSQGGQRLLNPQYKQPLSHLTPQRQPQPVSHHTPQRQAQPFQAQHNTQAYQFQSQKSFNPFGASDQQHGFTSTQAFGNDSYSGTGATNSFTNTHPLNDSENPFVNPNPLPFYEPPQSQKLNPLVQKYQQEFSLKWQTPNQVPRSSSSPPPPPPPVPQSESKPGDPPPPPPPSDGSAGKIVTTNILSLMDIINGTKKQQNDSIPGLDPTPDSPGDHDSTPTNQKPDENKAIDPEIVTIKDSPDRALALAECSKNIPDHSFKIILNKIDDSSKPIPSENNKKVPATETSDINSHESTTTPEQKQQGVFGAGFLQAQLKGQKACADGIKNNIPHQYEDPGVFFKTQQQKSEIFETGNNFGPVKHNDFFDFGMLQQNEDSVYTRMTLKAFNTKFREWERAFDQWKRANANHPDQGTYDKYRGQWESWKDKLLQQQQFILDNLPRTKQNEQGNDQEELYYRNNQPLNQIGNNQYSDDRPMGFKGVGSNCNFSGAATNQISEPKIEPVWETPDSYGRARAGGPSTNFFPTSGPLNQFSLRPGVRPTTRPPVDQVSRNPYLNSKEFSINHRPLNALQSSNNYSYSANQNGPFHRQNLSPPRILAQSENETFLGSNVLNIQPSIGNLDSFRRNFNENPGLSAPPQCSNDFGFTRRPNEPVQKIDSPAIIEHEQKITPAVATANISELFTRNRNAAPKVDIGDILEEETLPNAVTIDYEHGTKQPEVDPSVFNKDWEAEEYDSYNDRYEEPVRLPPRPYYPPRRETENLAHTSFDVDHFRRRPEIQMSENYASQENRLNYSHNVTTIESEMSLPRRDAKPLFPIIDFEMPTRIAPPSNEEEPHRVRQAPPRDLEPISPERSPVVVRLERGLSLSRDHEHHDTHRSDRTSNRETVRSGSRERVSRRRSRDRSRSIDRVRGRDRSYDKGKHERDRRNSRSDRRESPPHGKRLSPSRGRYGRKSRSRSQDRKTTNAVPRRPSSRDCRYGLVIAEDILNMPGRKKRPPQIVIILRGLPGSGKTHVAKLIKDREIEFGESAPRILSLDDYFTEEHDKTEKDPVTGKEIKTKVARYEYDPALERKYSDDLFKAFRKTVEAGLFRFIIVDCVNDKVRQFEDMANFAKARRFQVYIAEIDCKPEECAKRNIHHRTLDEIKKLEKGWDRTPAHLIKLDLRTLLQEEAIPNVEMEDVSDTEINEDAKSKSTRGEGPCDPDEDEEQGPWAPSKWETSGETLNKLDGLGRKRKKSGSDDEKEVPQTKSLDDWLKSHIREDYNCVVVPGKKRVRWKDIEQRREQERSRDIGFVVGQTDWNSITDSTSASAALTQIKYI